MLERLLRLVTRLSPQESKKRKSKELACYACRVIDLGNMSFSSTNPFVAVPPAYLAVQNMYNFPDTWKIVRRWARVPLTRAPPSPPPPQCPTINRRHYVVHVQCRAASCVTDSFLRLVGDGERQNGNLFCFR